MGKYALLIGVDTYGEGLKPLPAAAKDVAALREVLLNSQMGSFDEAKPLVNPTQPEMAREIELWFQDRQPEDLVLLFFSGHGVKDDRRDLYFAATNTEKNRDRLVRSTATAARFIHDCIHGCKAKYQVLILDCCFSGAFGDWVARDDGEIPLKEQLGAEGRVVLTSTSAVDYAFEEKGADLSIYTRYLVEGIATGAADEDGDGVITVDELHRYAGRKVKETSPTMSPTLITLKDEGFRIRVARSPQDDPKLKYRKEAECRATAAEFTIPAKQLLVTLRAELGLSDAEAEEIEAEVLKPHRDYQRKRQGYQDTLRQCLEKELPLSQRIVADLRDLRNHLRLKSEDVATIERTALKGDDLDSYAQTLERQRQQQQEERQLRQRYAKELSRALDAGYPLDRFVREGLKRFQESLGLSDEVSKQIEKPLLARREAEYQQQQQEQNQRQKRYEKEFSRALDAGYPLDRFVREGLKRFQESLGLSDEVVTQIEQPLLSPKQVECQQRQEAQRKQQEVEAERVRKAVVKVQRQREEAERKQQAETKQQKQSAADQDDLIPGKEIGYTRLRDLLKAQDWHAADKETYEVMIRAVGKKPGNRFYSDELLNFPCRDLRTIDRLWVEYSQGKFGFSVQKEIWQSCGSPTESNNNWKRFCVVVGWRSKGILGMGAKELLYTEHTFDLTAPRGHLPSDLNLGLGKSLHEFEFSAYSSFDEFLNELLAGLENGEIANKWVLFSRIKTCDF